jgi:hypothetical protein
VQAYNSYGASNSDTLSIITTENIVTSVIEWNASELKAYPNPTTGLFTIEGILNNTDFSFNLLTVHGKPAKVTAKENVIDITANEPGVYFLRLKAKKDIKTIKLILTR